MAPHHPIVSAHHPIVSAHRHGNEISTSRAALDAGADLVEIDVHLFWGRLEARHHKALWPLPLLFDRGERWHVGRWPVRFEDVVDALPADAVLHIDLKGWSPRLARRVRAALGDEREYVVSSRSWWLLGAFRSVERARVMRSIGAPWQLRWFRARHRRAVAGAVCIRSDRLTPEVAALLAARCDALYVWRVRSVEHADTLVALGASGLIVDDLEVVQQLVVRRAAHRGGHDHVGGD